MYCVWGINSGGNHWCKSIQAARETGALKEAKDKLEKRVEELTWRLQLEKRLRVTIFYFLLYFNTKYGMILVGGSMCTTIDLHYNLILCWIESQTDLEEEKGQEIATLRDALHATQTQVEEANARVIQEREAAWKAIEGAPPVMK